MFGSIFKNKDREDGVDNNVSYDEYDEESFSGKIYSGSTDSLN